MLVNLLIRVELKMTTTRINEILNDFLTNCQARLNKLIKMNVMHFSDFKETVLSINYDDCYVIQ